MKNQTMIVSKNVGETANWYCNILGARRGHGGPSYEQILWKSEMILQIHDDKADNHHDCLVDGSIKLGNGLVLWFETDDFEVVLGRVRHYDVQVDRGPVYNPNAKQMEIWFYDPNGYRVVIAGPSEYNRSPDNYMK